MRILCVATKPPWPPRDGGRLALALTLRGLAEAGHEIHVVAAAGASDAAGAERIENISVQRVLVPRTRWPAAAARALFGRRSLSVARHHRTEVERAVGDALTRFRPHVVHAEQLQALANCTPALAAGVAVVLRMQNVESQIWRETAAARTLARPLAFEAHRLQADERRALAVATHTVALTETDAAALRRLAPPTAAAKTSAVAPAFPAHLAAGRRLEGEPAIVLAGSAGWWPNRQATRWFLHDVLPLLSRRIPRAIVHLFGGDAAASAQNLRRHPAPAESVDAFAEGAIAAVPLFAGSGIRMRILEAWARGLPVVATSKAASGLDATAGRELSLADTADDFCAALRELAANRDAAAAQVDAGRAYLAARHDPARTTRALLDVYRQAIAPGRAPQREAAMPQTP